ncbi:hypothetical protein GCM10010289_11440 [Streptomyces violascens]|uniref:DUF2277 domain-containing protein n=2 Tax=Streptomyces violascens TaxID=67381 RepID=A0ABQ3QKJ6_9ACTN|nr:hypothetical protein GCM10010289_11440 [Streptomyces violascens]GHI37807.1 hypothetical protein Sviol_22150 [Streptomyces violascens]
MSRTDQIQLSTRTGPVLVPFAASAMPSTLDGPPGGTSRISDSDQQDGWAGAVVSGVGHTGGMCRSIKTLRPPAMPEEATDDDIRAAALQYVRKVSGFRVPAAHNREVFERAVDEIAEATRELLAGLEVRGAAARKPA